MLETQLKEVEAKIQAACDRAGRKREEVTLIAVSKTKPIEMLQEAYDLGVRVFGENKVQEITAKYDALPDDIHWHMIGHLQTNKVKYIIGEVDCIESVDNHRLLAEIEKEAAKLNKRMKVLLEVNIGREESKSGLDPDKVLDFVEETSAYPHIHVAGLMAIPPICDQISDLEDYFDRMYQLFLDIGTKKIDNVSMDLLSMGMSGDYLTAIRHGSNMVRLGTAIFGKRNY